MKRMWYKLRMGCIAALLTAFVAMAAVFAPVAADAHGLHGDGATGTLTNGASFVLQGGRADAASRTRHAAARAVRTDALATPLAEAAARSRDVPEARDPSLDLRKVSDPSRCPDDDRTPCSCRVDTLPNSSGAPFVADCRASGSCILPRAPERSIPTHHPIAVPTDRVGAASARGPPAI
jgi:hypothetical protein